jgi:competence ComEA-like helix-hairpin-helix protein
VQVAAKVLRQIDPFEGKLCVIILSVKFRKQVAPQFHLSRCSLFVFADCVCRGAGSCGQAPAHSVDLNSATAGQSQQVPGIGPGTAKAMVNFRKKSGPFQKVEDLLAIQGISKARFEKMRPYLTIGPMTRNSP